MRTEKEEEGERREEVIKNRFGTRRGWRLQRGFRGRSAAAHIVRGAAAL